jgi:hypothetical protein
VEQVGGGFVLERLFWWFVPGQGIFLGLGLGWSFKRGGFSWVFWGGQERSSPKRWTIEPISRAATAMSLGEQPFSGVMPRRKASCASTFAFSSVVIGGFLEFMLGSYGKS